MFKKVALFGLGHMGRNHGRELRDLGVLGCCVDIDPAAKQISQELGVPFVNIDISELAEIKVGAPISYKIRNFRLPPELSSCDIWDVATIPQNHLPLLLFGCHLGKEIFVEKPALESAEEIEYILCKFPQAKVGVNYIEMANPVLKAICKEIIRLKLKPVYFLHHREKNQLLERGKSDRVILDDLVHDLSEIDFFRGNVSGQPFSADSPRVSRSWLQTYKEAGFAAWTDARAEFSLEFADGTKAEIKGSFIDPYHRQFVIVTDRNTAFYGNTLERDFIAPAAAVIRGKENIANIVKMTKNCAIKDEETQRSALEAVKARLLVREMKREVPPHKYKDGKPLFGKIPLWTMLKNFLEAVSKEDLICSLDRAYYYQKIVEEAYEVSGHPEAMLSLT